MIAWWVNRIERKAHGAIERDELLWKGQNHGVLRTLLSGRWPFTWAILILAAVVGGLLLGYGARLGFGCNIGAPCPSTRN
uniref:Uncharacterized protein n=1 Tax=Marinobacter nauticus TaxID=2743 RepID=A0A455W5Y1_MARNT|nr:hypothetical protein YBY_01850 [Marinobacter nauticus]